MPPAEPPTCTVPCIPLARWPSMGQYSSYFPFLESDTVMEAAWPGAIDPVFASTPFPSISSACVSLPVFLTSNVTLPAFATLTVPGESLNSDSEIETVWGEAAAAVVAPAFPEVEDEEE